MKFRVFWLCLLISAFLWSDPVKADASESLTADEARLWRLAEKQQDAYERSVIVLRDKSVSLYMESVVQRLWQQVRTSLPRMKVKIVSEAELDAFAYPNGVCYITTGMLTKAVNESQLAVVLAHEMGHYVRRHSLAAFGHWRMSFGPRRALEGLFPDEDVFRSFLNDIEQQADQLGLEIVSRAGYCPAQALVFLEALQVCGDSAAGSATPSHAPYALRIASIRNWLEQHDQKTACRPPETVEFHQMLAAAELANAQAALRRGRWEQALDNISRYLKLHPRDPQAHFINGEIFRRCGLQGALSSAADAYLKAIRLDKGYAPAYRALGMLYYKAGDKKSAGIYFASFLALAPDSAENSYVSAYLKSCRQ